MIFHKTIFTGIILPICLIFGWHSSSAQAISFSRHLLIDDYERFSVLEIADLDDDGDLDFITSSPLIWWENIGGGEYSEQIILEEFRIGGPVYTGDFDNDEDIDIIAQWRVDEDEEGYGIYSTVLSLNNGDAEFEELIVVEDRHERRVETRSVMSDLDGDGDNDIAVATRIHNNIFESKGSVMWLENQDLEFESHVIIPEHERWWNSGYTTIDAADLDSDGDNDLVTANHTSGYVIICVNDGEGSFETDTLEGGRGSWTSVVIIDVDSDDDPDLIAGFGEGAIGWWENEGDLDFRYHEIVGREIHSGNEFAVGDMDGDGDPDVVTANGALYPNNRTINLLVNDGEGQFEVQMITQNARSSIVLLDVGDMNGDGDMDFLQGSRHVLSWWEQTDSLSVADDPFILNPSSFILYPAYPNPFNSSTTVTFALPRAGQVDLALYDIMGRRVRELTPKGWLDAGEHRIVLKAEGMAAGVYELKLESNGDTRMGMVTLIK